MPIYYHKIVKMSSLVFHYDKTYNEAPLVSKSMDEGEETMEEISTRNFFEQLQLQNQKTEFTKILSFNTHSSRYGLTLSEEEAHMLQVSRNESLRELGRIETGGGILPKIIYTFCDSPYLEQDTYLETLIKLQEIFFFFKNETLDQVTDDELLHVMRENFDRVCFGDLAYLEDTCLERFARSVRFGDTEYQKMGGV